MTQLNTFGSKDPIACQQNNVRTSIVVPKVDIKETEDPLIPSHIYFGQFYRSFWGEIHFSINFLLNPVLAANMANIGTHQLKACMYWFTRMSFPTRFVGPKMSFIGLL